MPKTVKTGYENPERCGSSRMELEDCCSRCMIGVVGVPEFPSQESVTFCFRYMYSDCGRPVAPAVPGDGMLMAQGQRSFQVLETSVRPDSEVKGCLRGAKAVKECQTQTQGRQNLQSVTGD